MAEYLRKVIVVDGGLTVTEAAKKLDITRSALSNVLRGAAALSPELALKLEQTFGLTARELLIAQLDEVLEQTRSDAT
jgi:addiction module HigA family antidote